MFLAVTMTDNADFVIEESVTRMRILEKIDMKDIYIF